MQIYNSLTGKKEEFKPLHAKKIGMYVCGPTVYDVGHLGHARSAVSFDVIRRYFLYKGFDVNFVSNITDVDDKMIKRAHEEKISEAELAERIIPEYAKDYGALSVLQPTHQPRATTYIPKMVALISRLMKIGVAYATSDGIYFKVRKYKGYLELSHKKLDDLQAGARIAVDEKKKNPEDFALWKAAKPGEPEWDGPEGMRGRPGWHIECSAMSADLLGETFDIHGGGIDLIFPHHEDERAQSCMAYGPKSFAQLWLHNGHIRINEEKMSKSLGNFFTIKEILAKYNPAVVRYFLLSTHYRMPIEFSDSLLLQAKNSLERISNFVRRINALKTSDDKNAFDDVSSWDGFLAEFEVAMDDDFEMAPALAAVFDLIRYANAELDRHGVVSQRCRDAIISSMKKIDSVLCVIDWEEKKPEHDIDMLITERNSARASKNFARADEIRKELEFHGIILEDTPQGTVWKKAL